MTIPDVRWLNPFVTGAFTVLQSFGVSSERDGGISVESSNHTSDDVTVIVPMVGALEGAVFYGLRSDTADRLAGAMLGDLQRVRLNDELIRSALGEFGNMVTGRASIHLEEFGMHCNIAPPLVALESRLILVGHPFDRIVVPVRTSIGPLHIRLAIREAGAPL